MTTTTKDHALTVRREAALSKFRENKVPEDKLAAIEAADTMMVLHAAVVACYDLVFPGIYFAVERPISRLISDRIANQQRVKH